MPEVKTRFPQRANAIVCERVAGRFCQDKEALLHWTGDCRPQADVIMRNTTLALLSCLAVTLFTQQAVAQLVAHFETASLDYMSEKGDCDVCVAPFCSIPTCELYFQMGVFPTSSFTGNTGHYPAGCGYVEHADGVWNWVDQKLTLTLPNMSTGARVYFGLFDEDPANDDDLLGTYLGTFSGTTTTSKSSNSSMPTGSVVEDCSGGSYDDDRVKDRFDVNFSVWFTDASPPWEPVILAVSDADSPPGFDNDLQLDFSWTPADDPHTGIDEYDVDLLEGGVIVAGDSVDGNVTSATVCSSGCTINYAVADQETYRFRVRARNGGVIQLNNATWSAWSVWSPTVEVILKYQIGGTLSGLTAGNTVTLQNSGGDDLELDANGAFAFPGMLTDGSAYDVSVSSQPASPSQVCAVSNGQGTVAGADVADVGVSCREPSAPMVDSALFVPLKPCRLLDTRKVGGAYGAGATRHYWVRGSDLDVSQGGAPFDCGIPATATAIQLNFTSVAPSAAGYLRAWPYDVTEPNATLLNFDAELGASNSVALGVCNGCANDFSVKIYKGPTHLVVDVVGYYEEVLPP
jgi:hypothetical protein